MTDLAFILSAEAERRTGSVETVPKDIVLIVKDTMSRLLNKRNLVNDTLPLIKSSDILEICRVARAIFLKQPML